MRKLYIPMALIMTLMLVMVACGQEADSPAEPVAQTEAVTEAMTEAAEETMDEDNEEVPMESGAGEMVFTLDDLAAYNGKDGNPAYVAVDGVVYDVTDVPAWKNGVHNGNMAGQDVSEAILKAPHGTSTLEGLTVVGTIEGASDTMSEESEDMEMTFTLEELAAYNGKDGNSAYVAVDGIVYDVTDVSAWKNGVHNGNMAGQDVSEAIRKAPHGMSTLEGLTVVGTLK